MKACFVGFDLHLHLEVEEERRVFYLPERHAMSHGELVFHRQELWLHGSDELTTVWVERGFEQLDLLWMFSLPGSRESF